MTERKFKSYTLWMKWKNHGWKPSVTCLNHEWPAANPIEVLTIWMQERYHPGCWVRGKTWMILPDDRKPKE